MRHLLVTAASAIALAAAPTIAAAQQAGARVPARAAEVQPSSEEVDGSALKRGFILPLLLVVGIIVALTFLIDEKQEDLPVSP